MDNSLTNGTYNIPHAQHTPVTRMNHGGYISWLTSGRLWDRCIGSDCDSRGRDDDSRASPFSLCLLLGLHSSALESGFTAEMEYNTEIIEANVLYPISRILFINIDSHLALPRKQNTSFDWEHSFGGWSRLVDEIVQIIRLGNVDRLFFSRQQKHFESLNNKPPAYYGVFQKKLGTVGCRVILLMEFPKSAEFLLKHPLAVAGDRISNNNQ